MSVIILDLCNVTPPEQHNIVFRRYLRRTTTEVTCPVPEMEPTLCLWKSASRRRGYGVQPAVISS